MANILVKYPRDIRLQIQDNRSTPTPDLNFILNFFTTESQNLRIISIQCFRVSAVKITSIKNETRNGNQYINWSSNLLRKSLPLLVFLWNPQRGGRGELISDICNLIS